MAALPATNFFPFAISNSAERSNQRLESRKCRTIFSFREKSASRRCILGSGAVSLIGFLNLNCELMLLPALSEEKPNASEDKEESVVGALKTLFDPNETTKAGKVLPKAYLKSARELVKTLRESLKEDTKDIAKFRRTADAAKESIRDYLNGWRGQKTVVNEESYVMLEKAIRTLASFYSKAGPSATLPQEVRSEILSDLSTAEEFL